MDVERRRERERERKIMLGEVTADWASRPPQNPEGALIDLSERPIMCSASYASDHSNELVYGGSDHALYAICTDQFLLAGDDKCGQLSSFLKPKKLYSKQYGHHDWVTGVAYTLDGNIVSGGMDGLVCFWSKDKRRCNTVAHHSRSISGVYNVPNHNVVLTSSYDCSVAVWDTSRTFHGSGDGDNLRSRTSVARANTESPILDLRGHKSPIIDVTASASTVASGGKDGGLLIWDLCSGQQLARVRGHDDSPCSCLKMRSDSSTLLTAGGDGKIKLWDPRLKRLLCSHIYTNPSNRDSSSPSTRRKPEVITCLSYLPVEDNYFVAASSDGTVSTYDIRWNASDSTKHRKATISSVTSFNAAIGGVHCLVPLSTSCIAGGDGAGMLIIYDILRNKICYGLSSSSSSPIKAVTTLSRGERHVVTSAGEDGNVLFYRYV